MIKSSPATHKINAPVSPAKKIYVTALSKSVVGLFLEDGIIRYHSPFNLFIEHRTMKRKRNRRVPQREERREPQRRKRVKKLSGTLRKTQRSLRLILLIPCGGE
ncbi:hypothetical protein ACYULU_07900 [Breznakiellaceae bacterium SP9]